MNILQLKQDIEDLTYRTLGIEVKAGVVSEKDNHQQRRQLALTQVLRLEDTLLNATKITFPNPHYSLSHCGSLSIAIGAKSSISGIGIDVEQGFPSLKSRRNFLFEEEENALDMAKPEAVAHLQKLWAIKEAAYKADPNNMGKTLKDYRVLDPDAEQGWIQTTSHTIDYCFMHSQGASLSVAITR